MNSDSLVRERNWKVLSRHHRLTGSFGLYRPTVECNVMHWTWNWTTGPIYHSISISLYHHALTNNKNTREKTSYPRCVCDLVNIRWSLNRTRRCTMPFGDAVVVVEIGLKFMRQLNVSIRRAVVSVSSHRFAWNRSPLPMRLNGVWALINDNFCDFIVVVVSGCDIRCVDIDASASVVVMFLL